MARKYTAPKTFEEHPIGSCQKSDPDMYESFCKAHPHLIHYVSPSTFLKYKPYWMRPAMWMTCRCPKCLEMEEILKYLLRNTANWHIQDRRAGRFQNSRPPDADPLSSEPHCWTCTQHNPLYAGKDGPDNCKYTLFIIVLVNYSCVYLIVGLDELYRISVCSAGSEFSSSSTKAFAASHDTCGHGPGPLLAKHSRFDHETKEEDLEENDDHEMDDRDPEDITQSSHQSSVTVTPVPISMEQLQNDVANLGNWPLLPGHTCPVLSASGPAKWREYRKSIQQYVDKKGALKKKTIMILQEVTGTRVQFLATFKRKLLEWLPHKRHLLWDKMWQKKRVHPGNNDDKPCSLRVANMKLGEVEIRIDFIKNAELRSPDEAQREFFNHQYVSLLCAVAQWKALDADTGQEVLRSRTYMFTSDDRCHDGAYATWCLDWLVQRVRTNRNSKSYSLYVLGVTQSSWFNKLDQAVCFQ